jgi:4-alpha-glucanotransferase
MLVRLARCCGIATSFEDSGGIIRHSPPVTLVRLINALLGSRLDDTPSAHQLQQLLKKTVTVRRKSAPAIIVAWDGRLRPVWLWTNRSPVKIRAALKTEDGKLVANVDIKTVDVIPRGKRSRVQLCWKSRKLPYGYYLLEVSSDAGVLSSSLLISAPRRIEDKGKGWGLFAPTYALPTQDPSGIGGFRELKAAAAAVKNAGGSFIGTLPLLATAYDGKLADPSPYAPLSRLFWNEIFLDTGERDRVSGNGLVDYAKAYEAKKVVFQREANDFFKSRQDRSPDFKAFLTASPYLKDYAEFRAAQEPPAKHAEAIRFHQYVQYLCHRQLSEFRRKNRRFAELYLDYPIGVHPKGFDATRFQHLFMRNVQVGAPPDMFFSKGQNWGFQPFHPLRFVEDHFQYFRATLNNYFRYARMLRLDHIMGLYRLYCIPEGFSAEHGAYVHYPFDPLLAALCLEAHRQGGLLAGEDLGTVPGAVRKAMTQHGISRMWVAQLEMKPTPEKTFKGVKPNMIASLNTHDLFPFAAYTSGKDIDDLAQLGVLGADEVESHRRERNKALKKWKGRGDTLQLALRLLAASPARRVIVNVEDLWRETKPQNIPGTSKEYANWRRRLPFPVRVWQQQKELREAVRVLNRYRSSRGQR